MWSVWLLGTYFLPVVLAAVVALLRPKWPGTFGSLGLLLGMLNTVPILLLGLLFMVVWGLVAWMVGLLLMAVHFGAWLFVIVRLLNPLPPRPLFQLRADSPGR